MCVCVCVCVCVCADTECSLEDGPGVFVERVRESDKTVFQRDLVMMLITYRAYSTQRSVDTSMTQYNLSSPPQSDMSQNFNYSQI